jgi:ATP-binding cassette, subfamily B, bacterial
MGFGTSRESSRHRYRGYLERRKADPTWASRTVEDTRENIEAHKQKKKRTRSFFVLFGKFWGMMRPYHWAVYLALATLTVMSAVALVIPAFTKVAIDYVLTDNPGPRGLPGVVKEWLGRVGIDVLSEGAHISERTRMLWAIGVTMVVLAIISVGVGMIGRWQMTRVTKRVQVDLRRQTFDHAIRLPLHRVQHYKSGGMASLLREDAGLVGDLLFNMIYNPWRAIITLAGTLAILAYTDWRFVLGGILCIPAVWVTHKTWISRIRPLYRDAKFARQSIDASTTEAFSGLRVVRGFARQRSETTRFVTGQHYMARIEVLTWWWSRIIDIAWSILIPLATAGLMVYGGTQILRGGLTIGDLMMFTTYLLMLLGPLETLTGTAANIQSNLAAFDRVLNLLEEDEEFADTGRGGFVMDRAQARGDIEVRGVWFAYPKAQHTGREVGREAGREAENGSAKGEPAYVLEDIRLQVRAGETIALVGPSGSGKTTLCNLIARFYDVPRTEQGGRGAIFMDGRDLREIDVASYRQLLGIVEQDVFLFDGTIAQNIAYARADASEAEIIAAAKAANAHEFVSGLERGYDTFIGERGVRLSGGQKQRIAIARAILADPLILILDEATSNLDSESEHLIQHSLGGLMRGRTSFVIAHRLSTIRSADRIVVMEKGRIVEMGSHEELIARSGRYAFLVQLQTQDPAQLGRTGGAVSSGQVGTIAAQG